MRSPPDLEIGKTYKFCKNSVAFNNALVFQGTVEDIKSLSDAKTVYTVACADKHEKLFYTIVEGDCYMDWRFFDYAYAE